MLPDSKPPQDVVDLVNQFKNNPGKYELLIFDNLFILHELMIEPETTDNPASVHLGPMVKRAYWRDAAGISLEMMKSRLGIR